MKNKSLIDRMRTAMITGLVLGAAAVSTAAAGVIDGVAVAYYAIYNCGVLTK